MAERSVEKTRNGKSDLNRAERDELIAVPGIGPAAAEAILKHREERGTFRSLDELDEVSGIGAQAVENLRERFTIPRKSSSAGGEAKVAGEAARRTGEKNVAAVSKASEKVAETAREMGEPGANVAAEAGRSSVAEAKAASQATADTFKSAQQAAARGYEEMGRRGQEEARSTVASGNAVLEGVQEWHREWLSCAQAQLEDSLEAGRELARCRTPKDLIDVQLRYTRSSMERFVTGSAKLAELTARIAGAGLHPVKAAAERQVGPAPRR